MNAKIWNAHSALFNIVKCCWKDEIPVHIHIQIAFHLARFYYAIQWLVIILEFPLGHPTPTILQTQLLFYLNLQGSPHHNLFYFICGAGTSYSQKKRLCGKKTKFFSASYAIYVESDLSIHLQSLILFHDFTYIPYVFSITRAAYTLYSKYQIKLPLYSIRIQFSWSSPSIPFQHSSRPAISSERKKNLIISDP